MPYNGVGTFTSLGAPTFPAVPNTYILASYFNATMNDIFAGLSSVMTRDGQAAATANWSMGGFKLTNLGNGSAAQDAVTYSQVFTSPVIANPTFTGTTNLETVAVSTAITVPTPAALDNSQKAANTAWVQSFAFSLTIPDNMDYAGVMAIYNSFGGINSGNA